jgi:hypothetical protein
MPRNVLDCPLPIKPPSQRDISLAEGGDRMAKARLRMNAIRTKQREEEIAKWEQANGPAEWRENPDLLSGAGPVAARLVSPRGENTRYVSVALRNSCLVCP